MIDLDFEVDGTWYAFTTCKKGFVEFDFHDYHQADVVSLDGILVNDDTEEETAIFALSKSQMKEKYGNSAVFKALIEKLCEYGDEYLTPEWLSQENYEELVYEDSLRKGGY